MLSPASSHGQTVLEACSCLAMRRASRAVSQAYDEFLAPCDITSGQFTLLAQLKLRGRVTISSLAHRLVIERTTLTRNIQRLQDRGIVSVGEGDDDRRKRVVTLTDDGEALLARSMPHWEAAQNRLSERLGHEWGRTLAAIDEMISGLIPRKEFRASARLRPVTVAALSESAEQLTNDQFKRLRAQLCMCTTLRRGARAITSFYDGRPNAITKISQFHILAAIDAMPGSKIVDLVEVLTLEQTTLTRMIQHLSGRIFVERGRAADPRSGLHLLDEGRQALRQGFAGWGSAQHVTEAIGNHSLLRTSLRAVLEAARSIGRDSLPAIERRGHGLG